MPDWDETVEAVETAAPVRTARCSYFSTCGSESPSSNRANLAFFQDKGPGSRTALTYCRDCSYTEQAHTPGTMARPHMRHIAPHDFVAKGAAPHDEYFCGCRGWD